MRLNLYQQFTEIFSRDLSKIGIYIPNGTSYSYRDIQNISAKIANALNLLGLKAGDRVAVQVEKTPYNLFLYFACLQSGIVYLPLNTGYTSDELNYFVKDANPALIVCDPSNVENVRLLNLRSNCDRLVHTLDNQEQGTLRDLCDLQCNEFFPIDTSADDVAVILYTSGTTGKPKGAMITHGGLLNNALALNQVWKMTNEDVVLHALPLFHVHGLFFACHTALLSAACIVFLPRFDLNLVIENLPHSTIF